MNWFAFHVSPLLGGLSPLKNNINKIDKQYNPCRCESIFLQIIAVGDSFANKFTFVLITI